MTAGTAPLGQLCRIQIGRTPRRDDPRFWNGNNPWASIRDLINGHVCETREGISDLAVSSVMPPITTEGTILVSFKLTIGRIAIAGRNLHHNEAIASLPIIQSDLVDRDYLRHVLPRVMEREQTNIAVLGHVLNKAKLQSLPIPLPSLDKQRRIVALLDRAAEIRRRAEAARAKARAIIPALFLDTFGDPATNPKGWPVTPFEDVVDDVTRFVPKIMRRDYLETGRYPIFDQGQIEVPGFTDDDKSTFSSAVPILLFGDHTRVFRLVSGTFARGADGVRMFRTHDRVTPSFLRTCLGLHGLPDAGYSRHYRFLKEVLVGIPPVALQTAFVDQVERVEALARSLDAAARKAEAVAAALSAEVFE